MGVGRQSVVFLFPATHDRCPKKGEPSASNIEGPPEVFENLLQCSPLGKKGGKHRLYLQGGGGSWLPTIRLAPLPNTEGKVRVFWWAEVGGRVRWKGDLDLGRENVSEESLLTPSLLDSSNTFLDENMLDRGPLGQQWF